MHVPNVAGRLPATAGWQPAPPQDKSRLIPAWSIGAHFFQNGLDRWVGLQECRPHHFAEFPARLSQLLLRSADGGIFHGLLMRCFQLRALFICEIRPPRATVHLKLSIWFVGRLRENSGHQLQRGGHDRHKEES